MEQAVTATDARVHFGEMIRRVTEAQEVIIVHRSGEAQMALISLERYEQLKQRPDRTERPLDAEAVPGTIRLELSRRPLPTVEAIDREEREEYDAPLDTVVQPGEARRDEGEADRVEWQDRIGLDPDMLIGKPVIKGTRLTVELILELLARGWPEEALLHSYPGVTSEDVRACLAFAREALRSVRVIGMTGSRRVRLIRVSRTVAQ